eukprot:6172936-Pleurochrysis_carterae.AAC.1
MASANSFASMSLYWIVYVVPVQTGRLDHPRFIIWLFQAHLLEHFIHLAKQRRYLVRPVPASQFLCYFRGVHTASAVGGSAHGGDKTTVALVTRRSVCRSQVPGLASESPNLIAPHAVCADAAPSNGERGRLARLHLGRFVWRDAARAAAVRLRPRPHARARLTGAAHRTLAGDDAAQAPYPTAG